MIFYLNKGTTGGRGARGETPGRYAGFQTFMSAVEASLSIKIFYGIPRSKIDKSGGVLVEEGDKKSLSPVDPFCSYSIPKYPLRHFPRILGLLDKH